MAGIYLHIPFCKQACSYCDFHFSTLQKNRPEMLLALKKELTLRREYLRGEKVNSIYFGGGTPSLLLASEIQSLIAHIKQLFVVDDGAEITLEANPDDLSEEYLRALKQTEVNRLSVGIQSFKQADLQLMNRAHSADESRRCLETIEKVGFNNYTLDLIFGLPEQSAEDWHWQLEQLEQYNVPHFSAYALTVEEKTQLFHQVKKGQVKVSEERAAEHFVQLQAWGLAQGYEQYELSNWAKDGAYARHNTAYWYGEKYLGIGPSAHSFNGEGRQWNVANNPRYLQALAKGELPLQEEQLSDSDRYNELVMTRLRLKKGLAESDLASLGSRWTAYFAKEVESLLAMGQIIKQAGHYYIPTHWRFHSDGIAANLFYA